MGKKGQKKKKILSKLTETEPGQRGSSTDTGNDQNNKLKLSSSSSTDILPKDESSSSWIAIATKAFGIDLILSEILRYVSTSDLIQFRRVNKKWMDIAESIIRHRNNINQIYLAYSTEDKSYVWHRRVDGEIVKLRLPDLTRLLRKSKNFLCTRFKIDAEHLDDDAIQTFLNTHGASHIKTLTLDVAVANDNVPNPHFRKLIFTQVPNIVKLTLDVFPKVAKKKTTKKIPKLVHLKTLDLHVLGDFNHYEHDSSLLKDLLESATNLEAIQGCGGHSLGVILSMDRKICEKIKSIYFTPDISTIQDYEKFANLQPPVQLVSIKKISFFNTNWVGRICLPRAVKCLNKILQSSQNGLQKIKRLEPINFLGNPSYVEDTETLKIPQLPNLQYLDLTVFEDHWDELHDDEGGEYNIFPTGFYPADNFPNLKRVRLEIDVSNMDIGSYFNTTTTSIPGGHKILPIVMPSVDDLEVGLYEYPVQDPEDLIEKCHVIFPNITNLQLKCFGLCEMPEVLKTIWRCQPQLKQLKIFVEVNEEEFEELDSKKKRDKWERRPIRNHGFAAAMDSSITGLDELTCVKLNKGTPVTKLTRGSSSILNMNELRNLHLVFKWKPYWSSTYPSNEVQWRKKMTKMAPPKLITEVTALQGFQKMPHLCVQVDNLLASNVSDRFEESMSSIVPFVDRVSRLEVPE